MPRTPAKKTAAAPTYEVGKNVKFIAYGDGVPSNEQYLQEGDVVEIVEVTDNDSVYVQIPNPDFFEGSEDSDVMSVEVLFTEAVPTDEEVNVFAAPEDEEVTETPAPTPAKTTAKAAAKAEAKKEDAQAKPTAKPAAKAVAKKGEKTEPKPAAKGKAKTVVKEAAKAEAPAPASTDDLPVLENEPEEILALLESQDDLVGYAQEIEASLGTSEYRLGAVLYHIKLEKSYLEMEGGEKYDHPSDPRNGIRSGWSEFLSDFFNLDYRKAMDLIKIYVELTKAGISGAEERVSRIGWSKAAKVASALASDEGVSAEELLALAETSSVTELSSALTERRERQGEDPRPVVTKVTLRLRFEASIAAVVKDTITGYMERQGLKTLEDALAGILTEYDQLTAPVSQNVPSQAATASTAGKAARARAKATA